MPPRQPRSDRAAIASWIALPLLAACASVDPTPDLADAAATAARHGAAPLDWSADWSAPASPLWDGHSSLSADLALAIALERNRALRASLHRIAAARATLAEADNPPDPTVAFAYGFPLDGLGGSMIWATAMQQLSWLWTRRDALEAADAERRATILDAAAEAVRVTVAVRAAHADLVLAEELARESEERRAATRAGIRGLDAAIAAGLEPANAAAANAARLADADAAAIAADAGVRGAKLRLLELLALAEAPLDFGTDGVASLPPSPRLLDDERVAELARTRRLDVAAAEARWTAAEAEARRAGAAAWSDLELGIAYERDLEGRDGLGPAVEARLPLFGSADVAAARAAVRRADGRLALEVARQRAVTEARAALAEWRAAEAALRAPELALEAERIAEEALRIAAEAGLASPGERATAIARRAAASWAAADARRAERAARFALLAALGGSWEETGPSALARGEGGRP